MKLYVVHSNWGGSGLHIVLARDEEHALELARAKAWPDGPQTDRARGFRDSLRAQLLTEDLEGPFVSEEWGAY